MCLHFTRTTNSLVNIVCSSQDKARLPLPDTISYHLRWWFGEPSPEESMHTKWATRRYPNKLSLKTVLPQKKIEAVFSSHGKNDVAMEKIL